MSEIGELLRESRIKKGLSIEDIQEITKIRSRYIEAIEEGNLDRLPGQFYAKAFIKAYAEVVDLDPAILEEHKKEIPIPELENVQVKPRYTSLSSPPSKFGRWLLISLIYLMIGLILLFIYMAFVSYSSDDAKDPLGDPLGENRMQVPYNSEPKEETGDGTKEDENEPKEDETTQTPKDEINITKTSTSTFKNRPYETYEVITPADQKIEVQLKFTDKCWFDLRNGGQNGKQLASTTLGLGQETEIYELDDQLWIHLGNPPGVDIYINGKQIKAGNEQVPKYISIVKKTQ